MPAKIIACRVMVDELRPFLPDGMDAEVLDISLHTRPKVLQAALQAAIDEADGKFDPIFLAYGLCSNAVVGLVAKKSRLVMPKQHDCIGIFLGSHQARRQELENEPGTFFLTRGYIEGYRRDNNGPLGEYDYMVKRFGREKADVLIQQMMGNYRRLVFLRTNANGVQPDREYAQAMAHRFAMRYEEKHAVPELLRQLVEGPWDDRFVVTRPGKSICYDDFVSSPN